MMNKLRSLFVRAMVLCLTLCLCLGAVTKAQAAAPDLKDLLEKLTVAFGLSQSDYENYDQLYAESLPIVYDQQNDSHYVALGGVTTGGLAVIDPTKRYATQVASQLGLTQDVICQNGLNAAGAVEFIHTHAETIAKADLITFQLDGVTLMTGCMDGALNGTPANWEAYITDEELLNYIHTFRSQMVAEYGPEYGEKNAESLAIVLEYLLYECVVYGFETLNALEALRQYNPDAVVLVLGLYNPLRGLSFTADGKTLEVGSLLEEMIGFCNAFLLVHTMDMENTAFVDCSDAQTNGFTNVTLNTTNENFIIAELMRIITATYNQFANQAGHDYIRDQILGALTEPCRHLSTSTKNARQATCTAEGYTGDRICNGCGALIQSGSVIPKLAHSYGSWTQTQAPTCTTEGQQSRSCTTCGHTETQNTGLGDHSFDSGKVTTQPSCEAEGTKTFTCTGCGKTKTETIAATGHTWDNGNITVAPGCETEGEKAVTCTVCGKADTEVIPATGHSWDDGSITVAPGCETEGEKAVTCTLCGKANTEAIPATGHNFSGYLPNGDATCQADGTKTATCSACGVKDTVADPGSKTDHTYADSVCTACGAQQPNSQDPAAEDNDSWHIWVIVFAAIAATGTCVLMIYQRKKAK